jgi:hypothetical protein
MINKADFWTAVIITLAFIITYFAITLTPAHCVWCPTYTCFGPCSPNCVCISPPGQPGGNCYGVERAPFYTARGWKILE